MKISGEIKRIFFPKEFGFDDFKFVSFLLKPNDKDRCVLCSGESFQIFETENVVLEGEMEETVKGLKFNFNKLNVQLTNSKSQKSYLKFIIGKEGFKKIYTFLENNLNETFDSEVIKEDYILSKIFTILDSDDKSALMNIKGFGEKTSQRILDKYKNNKGIQDTYNTLSQYGLSLKDTLKVVKKIGHDEAIEKISKNPFKLMKICNFSFNKCDLIFSKTENNPSSIKRLTAAITFVLKEELASGNTFTAVDAVALRAKKILDGIKFNGVSYSADMFAINEAIIALKNSNRIVITEDNNCYLKYVFDQEEEIRKFVLKNKAEVVKEGKYAGKIKSYEAEKGIKFGVEQKQAIENSMANKVSIITGGPGTGKTSSLAAIIKLTLEEGFEASDIALCAPTGKAARRMSESINGQLGTDFVATTIHTLLQVDPEAMSLGEDDDEIEMFVFNKRHRLPRKVIVIDETSMLDLKIAYSLISALRDDARVIFVGDIEQLPPVGYGYFLRDAIESGLATIKLLEVHRQKGDSTIISLSQSIRDEVLNINDCTPKFDYAFYQFPDESYQDKLAWIVKTFVRSVKSVGIDQTMILTPIKGDKNSEKLGAQQIGLAVQEVLLPKKEGDIELERNGWIFRIGSKVIVTKNNNQKKIVNGQIGYIQEINMIDKTITVEFEEEQVVELDTDDIDNLRLGYAITVHKSQGSEWKNVIYVCNDDTAMNKKPLAYTAITRAKAKLIIAGSAVTFLKSPWTKESPRRSRILN